MVDSRLSADMARRLPNARLTIYPDSGAMVAFFSTIGPLCPRCGASSRMTQT